MAVSGRTSLRMSILNQLYKDIRAIFFTETKCKIRFVYVRFNCKRKKWGKKWMEICAIEGGSDAMANAILKFQFFLEYSLKLPYHRQCSKCLFTWFNFAHNCTKHQLVLQSTSSCSNYLKRIHRLKQAGLFGEFS